MSFINNSNNTFQKNQKNNLKRTLVLSILGFLFISGIIFSNLFLNTNLNNPEVASAIEIKDRENPTAEIFNNEPSNLDLNYVEVKTEVESGFDSEEVTQNVKTKYIPGEIVVLDETIDSNILNQAFDVNDFIEKKRTKLE
jgi:hypothetical protein